MNVTAGIHTPPEPAARQSFFGTLSALVGNLPGLFSDRVDLLSLELQRAGLTLALMLLWGVTAAMLLLAAWLGIWGAVAAMAVQSGLRWEWAAFAVVLINALAAWAAIGMARRMAPKLSLPLTRRHLESEHRTPPADTEHHDVAP